MIDTKDLFLYFANNLFPSWGATKQRKDLSPQEQEKYQRIRIIIDEVGRKVGISCPESVKFYISKEVTQNACMSGSIAAIGSPVMALANDYFTHFDSPDIQQDPDYQEWEKLFGNMPEHPLDLAKYLENCSSDLLKKIQTLHKQFALVLTEEELKGVIAHELGHAKHLHSWKKLFYMIPLSWGAFKMQKISEPYLPFSGLFAFILFSLGLQQVTQMHEKEADEETCVAQTYNTGFQKFFKKHLLSELLKKPTELEVESMLRKIDFNTHPHPAKRIVASLGRQEREATPISSWEKGIACMGGILLMGEIYLKMSAALFIKKAKR